MVVDLRENITTLSNSRILHMFCHKLIDVKQLIVVFVIVLFVVS